MRAEELTTPNRGGADRGVMRAEELTTPIRVGRIVAESVSVSVGVRRAAA